MKSSLYVFSGLPATGKTTLSKLLAKYLKANYFRIDTIEQGLRKICGVNVQGEGYQITHEIVLENLTLGLDVVVDCVNPWQLTRNDWGNIAKKASASIINIEVICTDKNEHRFRAENRVSDIQELKQPSWEEIINRSYEEWISDVIKIDTSKKTIEDSFKELLKKLQFNELTK